MQQNNQDLDIQQMLKNSEAGQCECGSEEFELIYKLRRISPLFSPSKEEMVMPLEHYRCANCGKLFK